jgi:hypothetical protein
VCERKKERKKKEKKERKKNTYFEKNFSRTASRDGPRKTRYGKYEIKRGTTSSVQYLLTNV